MTDKPGKIKNRPNAAKPAQTTSQSTQPTNQPTEPTQPANQLNQRNSWIEPQIQSTQFTFLFFLGCFEIFYTFIQVAVFFNSKTIRSSNQSMHVLLSPKRFKIVWFHLMDGSSPNPNKLIYVFDFVQRRWLHSIMLFQSTFSVFDENSPINQQIKISFGCKKLQKWLIKPSAWIEATFNQLSLCFDSDYFFNISCFP